MNCPNCDSKITCSCQNKKASDGTQVCTRCLKTYEASIGNAIITDTPKPTPSTPSNVKVIYKPPRKIDSL